jgi:quercetin dioxygenase-like cupin family protein
MTMSDTTVKKVDAEASPEGDAGQLLLASGKKMALRKWDEEPTDSKEVRSQPYETIGYVLEGRALLELEGQEVELTPGDSWVVPPDAEHTYEILEHFVAIEATSPPARLHGKN